MGFDHDTIDINTPPEDPTLGERPLEIADTDPALSLSPTPSGSMSPILAGYRTFILGLSPFVLALTALIVLGITNPDLLTIANIVQIIGLGSTGPIGGMLARSYDKRTSLARLGSG